MLIPWRVFLRAGTPVKSGPLFPVHCSGFSSGYRELSYLSIFYHGQKTEEFRCDVESELSFLFSGNKACYIFCYV